MPNLANLPVADLQAGTANWSGQGYIDGLKMVWNSATSISVTSGAAFIPALSKCLPSPSTLTLNGLILTASTWYHVYLYNNAGTPSIECVTTAPAAAYYGTARTKTGDTSRRYLGSVKTDASGNILPFQIDTADIFWYAVPPATNGLRAISNGKATSRTSISLTTGIPVTATSSVLEVINTDTAIFVNMGNPSQATGGVLGVAPGGVGAGQIILFPTDQNQSVDYFYTSAPTNGFYLDIYGFRIGR